MRWTSRSVLPFLVAMVQSVVAFAAPIQGVGIVLGSSSHANELSISGVPQTYDSGGFTLGVDYQSPLSESITFNFLYLISFDSSPVTNETPVDDATILDSMLGLGLRYWPSEAMYFGAHAGLYTQSIIFDSPFILPEDGIGLGFGVSGGLEIELNEKTLLTLGAQYDKVPGMQVISGASASHISGFTYLIGVRLVRP